MKINNLQKTIEEYESSLETIEQHRTSWDEQIKTLLIKTLKEITERFPLKWDVQILDEAVNSEGVNITFRPSSSGIIEKIGGKRRKFIKNGGTIVFCQAYNGEVFVIIIYPYVEGLVEQIENKVLGKFSPDSITEEFIVEKVDKFLDEMVKWEKSTSGNTLGFKFNEKAL